MASMETLKLLDALLSGSSDSQKDRLLALYKEAFCSTDSFRDLTDLLQGSEFRGAVGQELRSKGEHVVTAGFTDAGSFGDRVTVMDYVVEKMRREMEASADYIYSANVAGTSLNVLDKHLGDITTQYYELLLNYVCCLYVTLYGDSALRNMNLKTGIRSADLVYEVSDQLCALFDQARQQPKPQVWRIVRTRFGGANMVSYSGFILEYGGVTADHLKYNCRQIAPCLFTDEVDSNVLCCGIGYLTSLQPRDGSRLYGAQVISKPAMNCLDSLDVDYASLNVQALLSTIAGSGVCVLDPMDLVELLNRYFMIRTARENKEKGCIYCGRNNCRHFRITSEFTM